MRHLLGSSAECTPDTQGLPGADLQPVVERESEPTILSHGGLAGSLSPRRKAQQIRFGFLSISCIRNYR